MNSQTSFIRQATIIALLASGPAFAVDYNFGSTTENFTITVRDVKLSAGAGFVVALTGDIMIMPGLPKAPAAMKIDCDNNGKISGLF